MEKIVIVGGGIVGTSVAYWLSKYDNLDITVLEKDLTYKKASFALSFGGFRHQFLHRENVLMGKFFRDFIKDKDELLSTKRNGYLLLFNEEQVEEQRRALKTQMDNGAFTTAIDGYDLNKVFPYLSGEGIALASYTDTQSEGWIDPYSLVNYMRGEATRKGVHFRTASVDNLKDINADKIVVATGSWINELLPDLPIKPFKHTIFRVTCPKFRGDMPLVGNFNNGVYMRPEGKEYLIGSPRPVETDGYDMEPEWNDFEEIVWPGAYETCPEMAELKLVGGWAGNYDICTYDQNAIVDKHPDYDNVYFAGGFSARGLMAGPGAGLALAELMQEGKFKTLDLSGLSYDRINNNNKQTRKEPYVL